MESGGKERKGRVAKEKKGGKVADGEWQRRVAEESGKWRVADGEEGRVV